MVERGQEGKIGAAENFELRDHEYRSFASCQIVVTNSVINLSSCAKHRQITIF